MNRLKSIICVTVFGILIFGMSAMCLTSAPKEYSQSERRHLAVLPELSADSVLNGEYAEKFEEYTVDQFPFRESFRTLKAMFASKVLLKKENNGLFTADGHISKTDNEENEYMMNYSAERFRYIADTFAKDKNAKLYFTIVPDKNYYLADANGYPSLDYKGFVQRMREKTEFLQYADITHLLGPEDYYTTDTHWRQENICDIAEHLADVMGVDVKADYKENILDIPFYGVYHGQLAMPFEPDTIKYLTNETIDNCKVTYYDTGKPVVGDMYNMKKAHGKDPYEMFLSGSVPLVTIENPKNTTGRELVMLRDSFGGSLAPLMAEGYSKITVVDIRYMQSAMIGNFVDFENADVLFIYSTALLNNSTAMK